MSESSEVATVLKACIPMSKIRSEKFAPIIEAMGDAQVVLIGEASHGTEEFYRVRADLTRELIEHYGFQIVGMEADFPDMYRVNRSVKDAKSNDATATDALGDFKRFPKWMWRNHATAEFAAWLRGWNEERAYPLKCGTYGLDLYSMYTSASKVIEFLEQHDRPLARLARQRYATLSLFRDEASEYAIALRTGMVESQRDNVVRMLSDLQQRAMGYLKQAVGFAEGDEVFFAEMNARVVKDAENYYRHMLEGHVSTWNIRDKHMCDTLQALIKHYEDRNKAFNQLQQEHQEPEKEQQERKAEAATETQGQAEPEQQKQETAAGKASPTAMDTSAGEEAATKQTQQQQAPKRVRAVVHIGDASKTSHRLHGEFNIGQLCRERFGLASVFNIGFSTNTGTVSAAKAWGGMRHTMEVNPGLGGSSEELHHKVYEALCKKQGGGGGGEGQQPGVGVGAGASAQQKPQQQKQAPETGYIVINRSNSSKIVPDKAAVAVLSQPRPQRYIGVQYVKHRERSAHYIESAQGVQYDAVIHLDVTHALRPLDADSMDEDEEGSE